MSQVIWGASQSESTAAFPGAEEKLLKPDDKSSLRPVEPPTAHFISHGTKTALGFQWILIFFYQIHVKIFSHCPELQISTVFPLKLI